MKKLLLLLISIILTLNSYTQEPAFSKTIRGAFGFDLGETYNINPNQLVMFCKVKPKLPYRQFQHYDISVTSTQKIFLIRAEYTATSDQDALNEISILENNLYQRYGKIASKVKNSSNKNIYHKEIVIEDRVIGIVLEGRTVRIMYRDHPLGQEQNQSPKRKEINAL